MTEPAFANMLFEYDDTSSLTLPKGSRFIRKLPDERSLGYLHKLFPPTTNAQMDEIEASLGRRLPIQYQEFLLFSDGAYLFDNSVYLYGFAENSIRSIEPEHQTALSLRWENRLFSKTEADRWAAGWTKIGSVVGWDIKLSLLLHLDGSCQIEGASGSHVAKSFSECLTVVIDRLGPCFSHNGLIDQTYASLEASLASLIRVNN